MSARNRLTKWIMALVILSALGMTSTVLAQASGSVTNTLLPSGIRLQFDVGGANQMATSMKIVVLMTLLSLAPSFVIMTTSFTRILIVFGFLRQALGTQQTPPTQVLTGLTLFLTIFIMAPVWQKINSDALQPYMAEQISDAEAWKRGTAPLREFMSRQTGETELNMFIELSKTPKTTRPEDIGMEVIIPAFMISEMKTAFKMGFLIYLPFLVIDLVISVSLMAMGMMMLPPMMISLPIKILFFVLADGWTILVRSLVTSFTG